MSIVRIECDERAVRRMLATAVQQAVVVTKETEQQITDEFLRLARLLDRPIPRLTVHPYFQTEE